MTDDPRSILDIAKDLTTGDRPAAYGHPLDNFTWTAELIQGYLRGKIRAKVRGGGADWAAEQLVLSAEDAAIIQILVKIAREGFKGGRDNRIDMAGYTNVVERIVEERARREALWRETEYEKEARLSRRDETGFVPLDLEPPRPACAHPFTQLWTYTQPRREWCKECWTYIGGSKEWVAAWNEAIAEQGARTRDAYRPMVDAALDSAAERGNDSLRLNYLENVLANDCGIVAPGDDNGHATQWTGGYAGPRPGRVYAPSLRELIDRMSRGEVDEHPHANQLDAAAEDKPEHPQWLTHILCNAHQSRSLTHGPT